ncbi:glycoside hydrolase family 13 protein [Mycena albidolilacea]|uniref:Glycoside hydrolase family 13 protein n=1 Tax=Mycena albidolilacea TaxID=1033008 RepID=A0AAD7A2L9_9AGAR|nr:glycoside hydrolase family 13 protein [Mycena albidolilacea]
MKAYPETWWKDAVVYQIYPISFLDSNGDGLGDLNGIAQKLDYLKDLGVDVLWLSPIYKSPLADMGYDISDYRDIDARYGTLKDWDNLLAGVHGRGMKLMMDLVVNHTSDEHAWFKESKSSKTNPKRDWYIWRPPKYDAAGDRHPPNNWKAQFQGSVWEYDTTTDEYYLHLFHTKQPDLNWENPEVRQAVWDLMLFWVKRGCDGFRMDVINLLSKVPGLPDAPVTIPEDEYQEASAFFANGPRVHEFIQEMFRNVLSQSDLITVGEAPFTHSPAELARYVLPENKELNMAFHFELVDLDSPRGAERTRFIYRPWKLSELKEIVNRWQTFKREEGFWNSVYIENHDQGRSVTRWGNDADAWRTISAKMLAILEVTLGGTQYVFQGQEIGIRNFPRSWGIEEYKDVASQNFYHGVLAKRQRESGGDPDSINMSDILDGLQKKARDHGRIPMQWDSSAHAGFTTGTPWMRVNDDYPSWNTAAQLDDPQSVHAFWKQALRLRKEHKLLIYGDFQHLVPQHEQVFAYIRAYEGRLALVVLNFTDSDLVFRLPSGEGYSRFKLVFGNYYTGGDYAGGGILDLSCGDEVSLRAYEGKVYVSDS